MSSKEKASQRKRPTSGTSSTSLCEITGRPARRLSKESLQASKQHAWKPVADASKILSHAKLSAGPLESIRKNNKHKGVQQNVGAMVAAGYSQAQSSVPGDGAQLTSIGQAMMIEEFGPNLMESFRPESQAATEAIQSGVYIGYRCPEFKWDCFRVGRDSRCFCGHLLLDHSQYNGRSVKVPCRRCECQAFAFIPTRPQDVGEYWLLKRKDYDPLLWRAKCRCKHTHEEHAKNGAMQCKQISCRCSGFISNFLCAACDRHWEDHETIFETEAERKKKQIPFGSGYLPFANMPDMRNMAITGRPDDAGIHQDLLERDEPIPEHWLPAIGPNTQARRPGNKKDIYKPN